MALVVKKTRGRGNSDPIPTAQAGTKRPRTNSLEAALYDHDYSDYARATFHPEKRTQKPWALDPPPPLFDYREWTGKFSLFSESVSWIGPKVHSSLHELTTDIRFLDLGAEVLTLTMLDDTIRHMYDYTNWRLKLRRISPRSLPFLETLRDTAQKAIESPTVELKT